MEIKTLEKTSIKDLLIVFNESFSDYFVPFSLNENQLKSKMTTDKIDLKLSVGAFEKGRLIAFILHGFDIIHGENIIYNGGTGVIPTKRGSGLTKKMYDFIIPILEIKRINKIILEAINTNIQAIKSYRKVGFKITRELACYKGILTLKKENKLVQIKKLKNYNWELKKSFWDMHPTWQNSDKVLDKLISSNISLGAYISNCLVGYVIYNPKSKRLQQIAVSKNYREKGIASTLLLELEDEIKNSISIINIDKNSCSISRFLMSIGLENYLEQVEMELKPLETREINTK